MNGLIADGDVHVAISIIRANALEGEVQRSLMWYRSHDVGRCGITKSLQPDGYSKPCDHFVYVFPLHRNN